MLVNNPIEECMFDKFLSPADGETEKLQDGVYLTGLNSKPFGRKDEYGFGPDDFYGVADDVQNILDHFDFLSNPDKFYTITMTKVSKHTQPEEGGWRWHKWGPYIGKHDPQCEYIRDEPEIEEVYVFHIYEVEPTEKEAVG